MAGSAPIATNKKTYRKAEVLHASQCELGEGPVWHARRKSCFWVDIEGRRLFEFSWLNRSIRTWKFEQRISLAVIDKMGHLLLGLQGGLARFDPSGGIFQWLLDMEQGYPDHRCNDGRCDSEGRLWIGTMQLAFKKNAGKLYCVDQNKKITEKLAGVTISNGIVWSLDGSRMYYVDSPTQTVQSYLFDPFTGSIFFERIAVEIPVHMGTPDGLSLDIEGMLWVAHWGGFGIFRWNPHNGKLIDKIEVPAPNVTSCAFAGEKLNQLVITTAWQELDNQQRKMFPASGDTFIASVDVPGKPDSLCSI